MHGHCQFLFHASGKIFEGNSRVQPKACQIVPVEGAIPGRVEGAQTFFDVFWGPVRLIVRLVKQDGDFLSGRRIRCRLSQQADFPAVREGQSCHDSYGSGFSGAV